MKKKILFIIWSFSYGGGAERILSNVVNNMDPEKYDIDILEYQYAGIKKEKINDNINLLPPIINVKNRSIFNRIKNAIIGFLITRHPEIIRKRFLNKTYDVEISFNNLIPTFLLNEKSKLKLSWVHGAIYDIAKNERLLKVQDKYFKRVDKIVAISNETYNSIVGTYPKYRNKTVIIYNGYEFDNIIKMAKEKVNEKFDIICCGRLDENKDPVKLLKIMKMVKEKGYNFKLAYIGEGILKQELEEKIANWNMQDSVKLLGFQNNPYKYMNESKIICMTSHSEGFPTVIIEGMTLGKPFISTPVAGVDEMSDNNKCGYIESEEAKYTDRIIQLLNDENLYKEMSKNCKHNVKRFSMSNQIKEIENLIEEGNI